MKTSRFLIVVGLSLGLAQMAHAVPCDGVDTCALPGFPATNNNNPPTGWAFTTTRISGIRAQVSVSAPGNVVNSRYYFAATNTNFGATATHGQIVDSGDGTTEISAFLTNATATPTDPVNGGSISQLVGGQPLFMYAQACPSGQNFNSAQCSLWNRIRTNSVQTSAYPLEVSPQPPFVVGDSANNSISLRTNLPAADPISVLTIAMSDLDNSLSDNISVPYIGNGSPYVLGNADYSPGVRPNTRYRLNVQATYEYAISVPTAGAEQIETFYTRPVDPVPGAISGVSHCAATLAFTNSSGNPANPSTSMYEVCLNNGAGCLSVAIGGNTPATSNNITFTGLLPGTDYTADVKVLNRGGSPWGASATVNYPGNPDFSTDGTTGLFTVTNITTNSADFNFPVGFDVVGAVSWQRMVDGVLTGAVVPGLPPATIAFTGLLPNRAYNIQLRVNENSCNYTVPPAGLALTTTPNDPQTFGLTAPQPRQLTATWAANGNPATTVYQIQYSTDAFATFNTVSSAAGATTANITLGIIPQTLYSARVRALTVGGGSNSGFSNTATATTPNEAPVLGNLATCTAPTGNPPTSSCNAVAAVTDNGPIGELRCSWSVVTAPGGGTVTFTPAAPQTATNAPTPYDCPAVSAEFSTTGGYTLRLTVTDTNGTGLSATDDVNVNVGQTPTTISVLPSTATVIVAANRTFIATVLDQFGVVIAGQSVTWSVNGGGTLSTNNGTSTTFTATTSGGPFILTATLGAASDTSAIMVVAAGPFFTTSPTLSINPSNLTGNVSARGNDNDTGAGGEAAISYSWTLESGPSAISVSPNNNHAARDAVVTFSRAGNYRLHCTISNGNGSFSEDTSIVNIPQVPSGLAVCPTGAASPCVNTVTLKTLQDQAFEARIVDQFGVAVSVPPSVTWGATAGNINSQGVFSGTAIGTQITITAQAGALSGSINVLLVSFDVSNAKAFPVPWKASQGVPIRFDNLGSNASIHIYTTSGRLVFETRVSQPTFDWTVVNTSGESIASGVYFYVIESPEGKKNGKLIIIK